MLRLKRCAVGLPVAVVLAGGGLLLAAPPGAGSLLTNGGFEDADLSAWSQSEIDHSNRLGRDGQVHIPTPGPDHLEWPREGAHYGSLAVAAGLSQVASQTVSLPLGAGKCVVLTGWIYGGTIGTGRLAQRHFIEIRDGDAAGPVLVCLEGTDFLENQPFSLWAVPTRPQVTVRWGHDAAGGSQNAAAGTHVDGLELVQLDSAGERITNVWAVRQVRAAPTPTAAPTPPLASNLLINGGFEDQDLSDWQLYRGTENHPIERDSLVHIPPPGPENRTKWPREGRHYGSLAVDAGKSQAASQTVTLPLGPGTGVVLTGWIYGNVLGQDNVKQRQFIELRDGDETGPVLAKLENDRSLDNQFFTLRGVPTRPEVTVLWGHDGASGGYALATGIHVDGLDLIQVDAAGEKVLAAANVWAVRQVRAALARAAGNDREGALAQLEALLDESERFEQQESDQTILASMTGTLPQIYCAIAAVKQAMRFSRLELRAVCFEGVQRAPDAYGLAGAVLGLAETTTEIPRDHLLRHIARRFRSQKAGEAAAAALIRDTLDESGDQTGMGTRLEGLAIAEADTPIAQVALRALVGRPPTSDHEAQVERLLFRQLDLRAHGPLVSKALRALCERFVETKQSERLESLCVEVAGRDVDEETLAVVREIVFKRRMASGDILGAIAVAVVGPGEGDPTTLLAALNGIAEYGELRRRMEAMVQSVRQLDPVLGNERPASERCYYEALGSAASESGLHLVSLVASWKLVGIAGARVVSVADGRPLDDRFALDTAKPRQLATFWRAQHDLAMQQWDRAGLLLRELTESSAEPLRSQVLLDLARVCRAQRRLRAAGQLLDQCAQIHPASAPVAELRKSIVQEVGEQRRVSQMCRDVVRRREGLNDVSDPQEGADTLLAMADLEVQLGLPRRAAAVLEELISRYPRCPAMPEVLQKLVSLYESALGEPDSAKPYRNRLLKEYPQYAPRSGKP